MILFGYINVGFTPLLLHESLELTCEFEQRQVGDLIVEVGGEIIVLRIAHAHLVLQHLCHGCYALTIAVACHLIYILGKQIVVALLAEVALVVGEVVHRIGILCLHALQRILVRQFGIVDVDLCLSNL